MTDTSARDDARTALRRILEGAMTTQLVGLAAEIGLADAIAEPTPVADVAAAHDMPADQMLRLLRALTAVGCCRETGPGTFVRTDLGALLSSDDPASMRSFARLCASEATVRPWLRLGAALRGGGSVFTEEFGYPPFEYAARHPEHSAMFNTAMSENTRTVAAALPERYDLDRPGTVVDVGGGNGTLLAAILRAAPRADGVLFDLEAGVTEATAVLAEAGVLARCGVVTGDFRESVPDADTYVIKSVLHNWDDGTVTAVLRHCRDGLRPGGRILVVDVVLPERAGVGEDLLNPYLADLHMLVVLGGRERTASELGALCSEAGLRIERIVDLGTGDVRLVEIIAR